MPGTTVIPTPSVLTVGFFGKLPSRGDFIGRYLPKAFVAPWDAWLQAAMARSREQMGDAAWRESYRTSPLWRFLLDNGVCGTEAYAGIMMPSMDRVGRYYPLTVAAALPPNPPLLELTTTAAAWFARVEELALAALERDALDLEAFSQEVAMLGAPLAPTAPIAPAAPGMAWHCLLPHGSDVAQALPLLVTPLLRRAFPATSVWWTEGSPEIDPCLLICAGLPPSAGFAALLRGDWRQSGWNEPLLGAGDHSLAGLATSEES